MWVSRTIRLIVIASLCGTGLCGPGCAQRKSAIWSERGAAVLLKEAVDAPLPDTRRQAIERITASRYVTADVTVRVMDVILRTDSSPIVRREAARCLGASGHSAAWPPLLAMIPGGQGAESPLDGSAQALDDRVLAAVLDAAVVLLEQRIAPPADSDLLPGLSRLLAERPSREVRLRCARALGYCADPRAVSNLIDALDQGDFAVAYAAEASLRRLTGADIGYNAGAWRRWLEQVEDPLSRPQAAGQDEPAEPSWWGRMFDRPESGR